MTEYYIEGRFPGSGRVLGVGPRRKSYTTLSTGRRETPEKGDRSGGSTWKGTLDVRGRENKGKIVFEMDTNGKPFDTEGELIDYLVGRYSVTHLRDMDKYAVETGG